MKCPETNWTVRADLPTPPDPSTTTLNSFISTCQAANGYSAILWLDPTQLFSSSCNDSIDVYTAILKLTGLRFQIYLKQLKSLRESRSCIRDSPYSGVAVVSLAVWRSSCGRSTNCLLQLW